jgi:rod shape-determining protein MreD
MTRTAWAAAAMVGALADVLVSPHLEWRGIRPDVCVSILALSWLAIPADKDTLLAAWGVGLVRDALSVGPIGVHALAFLVTAWAGREAKRVWCSGSAASRFAFIAAAVACAGTAAIVVSMLAGGPARSAGAIAAAAGSGLASGLGVTAPSEAWMRIRTWVRSGYARLQWQ